MDLDIDDRAAQLAYFAVMMKARSYDRRFFSRGIQPHVYAIQESNDLDKNVVDYFVGDNLKLAKDFGTLVEELHDAKEYGSILNITSVDFAAFYARVEEVKQDISLYSQSVIDSILPLIQEAEALAKKYDVVVTNPPYMGSSNMNAKLNDFIKKNYADYKSDFFSAFIVRCKDLAKNEGYLGFFSPYVWMFIQAYEKLRNLIYSEATIETLIQFEYSAFEEATVPVCTFVLKNSCVPGKKGCYFRLTDFRGGMDVQRQKTLEAITDHDCGYYFEQCSDNFSKIPGAPVAYWVSEALLSAFNNKPLSYYATPRQGLVTGDNDLFLRLWYEVSLLNIDFHRSTQFCQDSGAKWFPCNKGGGFRKWYGNFEYIVDWENDGERIKNFYDEKGKLRSRPQNSDYYFRSGLTWGTITSGNLSMRHTPSGFIPEHAGGMIPLTSWTDIDKYLLALMNSNVAMEFLSFLSPTLRFTEGPVGQVPVICNKKFIGSVAIIVTECEKISKDDWDSFETSWDFQCHPLVRWSRGLWDATSIAATMSYYYGGHPKVSCSLELCYMLWQGECNDRFNKLKANEEELNRIFIDIYGLQDELTPEEEDKDVTVRKADLQRDIKSLISYAVGCMFGRYSLDVDGLSYAGGEWDASKYKTYQPDYNGILPICDDEYFTDDIVGHFIDFIRVVFGEDTLEANLQFIADALGGSGTSREVIRKYFLNDFYADHCKIYQKRPIYWLFDSGKKNGFKCLIYIHRYRPDTIARIRTDYVHEQQARYRTAIADLENRMINASTSDRIKMNKQLKKLQDQSDEIHDYEEKIHHLADQFIDIDLDDGVKVNYAKFQDVLAKIK